MKHLNLFEYFGVSTEKKLTVWYDIHKQLSSLSDRCQYFLNGPHLFIRTYKHIVFAVLTLYLPEKVCNRINFRYCYSDYLAQ